jgi:DNA-directed RNA polymerase subunit RPC12/RpoP
MKVTRGQIVARGLTNRCPNCGGRTLFKPGKPFVLNPACPRCGLRLERDEGFFLGSMSLNYGVTLVGCLAPIIVLAWCGVLSLATAAILAGAGAVIFPLLFYRSSRSWWLMNYYVFLPQHLPANRDQARDGEAGDENT